MSPRRIVDLSQPVGPDTPVFPGDGPVRIEVIDMPDQTTMNLSRIELSVHTGTHMDAPFHFFPGAAAIDRVPLERCMDQAPYPAHKVLLGAGVPIVENLTNLDAIGAHLFDLIVLPLRLAGRDGSPVRAIAVIGAG